MTSQTYTQGDWVSCHDAVWRRWLAPWAGQPGVRGLEIGCCEGRSTCWFADSVLTGRNSWLTCIDPWVGPYSSEAIYQRWRRNTAGLRIELHRATSRDALARIWLSGQRYDWAYVDGSHEAADCLADLCVTWALLRPGGLLIADDYAWSDPSVTIPPRPAIDGWRACYGPQIARWEISDVAGPQFAAWKLG